MDKLIIGNVSVSLYGSNLSRSQAVDLARKAIKQAVLQGKALDSIEIDLSSGEPQVKVTEKITAQLTKKTLRQSIYDAVLAAAQEKLYRQNHLSGAVIWVDPDTNQEFFGETFQSEREKIINELKEWLDAKK